MSDETDLVTWTMPRKEARDLLGWLRHNRPLGMPDSTFDGLVDAVLSEGTEHWRRHPQENLSRVAAEWSEAEPFKDTWDAYRKDDINIRWLDTNMLRIGWPKPTIYREHETIHVLANLVDQLRKKLNETCRHENFISVQNGMWNHDTCLDCGTNGPTYDIDLGLNDDEGRPGNFDREES